MRWVIEDWLRTLFDMSVQAGGVLDVQDDLNPPIDDELPYDRLQRRCVEHGLKLYDFRQVPRPEEAKRGRSRGTRKIENVTALWWHQMAAAINSPYRALSIPVHGAVMRNADIVLLHPIRSYMYGGHAANKFAIHIEIACRAAGIKGDPRTFWRSKKEKEQGRRYEDLVREPTLKQILAGEILGEYYVTETWRQGGKIVASGDHRMSHRSRESDPGQAVHRGCTVAVAAVHDLEVGPVVGSGKPNPTVWSGKPGVRYNWRVKGY